MNFRLTLFIYGHIFKNRGLQKKINRRDPLETSPTVQAALEEALAKLSPSNEIEVAISSRTDKGVHALHSIVHVDLERRNGDLYDLNYLTSTVNRNLSNAGHAIRVLRTDVIPQNFHCRYNATSRTYLYRVAIAKRYLVTEGYQGRASHINPVPIEEAQRCWFLANPEIDIERIKEASQMFVGRHDYRTFMNAKTRNDRSDHPMYTIRKIDEIAVSPGKPLTTSLTNRKATDLYDFWDVTLKGRSFLYKQVRRIIGTLICHGQGKITQKDIYEMLTIPSKHNWISQIPIAPPYALYLAKVDFDWEKLANYHKNNESDREVKGEEGATESN